jgi:hypothetical protein
VFVKTTEVAAVAAAHSVDPDRWQTEFSAVIDRIAPRFARYEPLRHAAELMAGMVSGLDRKNCWTIAEHRGAATPTGYSICSRGPAGTPRRSAMICVTMSSMRSAIPARSWWSTYTDVGTMPMPGWVWG